MYKDCDHENMDIPKLNVLHQISLPQDSKNHDKLLKYGSEEKVFFPSVNALSTWVLLCQKN